MCFYPDSVSGCLSHVFISVHQLFFSKGIIPFIFLFLLRNSVVTM